MTSNVDIMTVDTGNLRTILTLTLDHWNSETKGLYELPLLMTLPMFKTLISVFPSYGFKKHTNHPVNHETLINSHNKCRSPKDKQTDLLNSSTATNSSLCLHPLNVIVY